MKIPHSIRNFILAVSFILAVAGTGFSAWYFTSGTEQTEVQSMVKVTLCSDNGDLHFTRNMDGNPDHDNSPYIGYDSSTIGIYQNNSFTNTAFSLTYTPFSSYSEIKMILNEELWIPNKAIGNNGNPFSLSDIITIQDTTFTKKAEQEDERFTIYERTLEPLAKESEDNTGNTYFTVDHSLSYTSSFLFEDRLNPGQYTLSADTYSSLSKLIEDPSAAIQLVFTAKPDKEVSE